LWTMLSNVDNVVQRTMFINPKCRYRQPRIWVDDRPRMLQDSALLFA